MRNYHINKLSPEISLKPFMPPTDDHITAVCREIWRHWYGLAKHSDEISVLIWLGDGTDMLEFDGNMDRIVDWGMYMGFAEKTWDVPEEDDPKGESIVGTPRVFRPDAVPLSYNDIKRIFDLMRATAKAELGVELKIGIPFEPGTEFCRSTWRYEHHPEIILGSETNPMRVIDCAARFKADNLRYAGWPDGIPEGLDFGTFLGRQTRLYMDAMGVDYIWFSNSFGYGRSPYAWGGTGPFFDGQDFATDVGKEGLNRGDARAAIVDFWKAYRAENDRLIECRGTDFTTGMNIVNHAVDYRQIYATAGTNTMPPPNTPWPALTKNHGIALAGFLSQLSGWRGERLPFRMYTSDPWWCNSAWFDAYQRLPNDIQLTMSLSTVDEQAELRTVNEVKFLSIDTTWGDVPEEIADEMVPAIKRSLDLRPDGIAPVLWVYPWQRNHELSIDRNTRHEEVLHGDLLMQAAINNGFPVASSITDEALPQALATDPAAFTGRILLCPAPEADSELEACLLQWLADGGKLLCYGAIAHASPAWLAALGLANGLGISGELTLRNSCSTDVYHQGQVCSTITHHEQIGSGAITATAAGCTVLATVGNAAGDERVVLATKGTCAWTHGPVAIKPESLRGRGLNPARADESYPGEALLRHALATLGWEVAIVRNQPDMRGINCTWSSRQDQFVFSAFSADPTVSLRLNTPLGAPLIQGRETVFVNGKAEVPLFGCFQERVFLFVEQEHGRVTAHRVGAKHFRYQNRINIFGLENATLRVLIQRGCEERTDILTGGDFNHYVKSTAHDGAWIDTPWGRVYELRAYTGQVSVAWTEDEIPEAIRIADWDALQK